MPLEKVEFMLGNMFMRKKDGIGDLFPTNSAQTCSCCSTSQVGLHDAKAMVLCCMDFRLRDNVGCQLNLKGYLDNYDEVITAGSSLGYNGLLSYTGWNTFVDQHIELAYNLHHISEIIIVDHEKCGAFIANYSAQYGGTLTKEQEYALHETNQQQCANTLWTKFNPTNGTVKKIPHLVIIAYLISIDGCNLTEIYRKSS